MYIQNNIKINDNPKGLKLVSFKQKLYLMFKA